jgi:hypothetical protein
MIFHQHKLIFCHIPRTGGSTISKILNGGELFFVEHKTHTEYKNSLPASLVKQYKFFSVVRNPFDRAVSLYARDNKSRAFDIEYFREWTRRLLSQIEDQKVQAQTLYVKGFTKDDLILKYENLAEDSKTLLGIDLGSERLHKTDHAPYPHYYDVATETLVRDYYYEDFVKFNYSLAL